MFLNPVFGINIVIKKDCTKGNETEQDQGSKQRLLHIELRATQGISRGLSSSMFCTRKGENRLILAKRG